MNNSDEDHPQRLKRIPKTYCPHEGTLKIARETVPGKAAGRAVSLLRQENINLIDFFIIGSAANQQAMKAMSLFRIFLEDETEGKITLAFAPIHVRTFAESHRDQVGPVEMDATVWRTVILTAEQQETLDQTMKDPVDPSK